ncbi:MAG: UMP kinase [gamma proteobacterium symbiont of Ctena orbiculata]|nr:UMP kinase [Candidatus Thiodiazotropha taylori]MBT3057512.1 UMP kinase [Candidatus Thiodiazotropha sp. (ex Lucina pensylvanica)]MBV2095642.1 UMP kinase [Candidatus Thiodiazotropha sp. (ex Codakia orbicularis)]PUB76357.1 MAG: UMP kinase [gamma proteobacterium symbiont of Ctena orbiculata]MBT3062634.1 UMP kinase [Candidatus Thiodiazotropha sp. (ex Lucina pensylvanica)]
MTDLICQRILLKLSGEALMGGGDFGIDPAVIRRVSEEIRELVNAGVQIGLVIGGGNIFRGAGLAEGGFDRVRGDHMGMLATVMNSLAMQDALSRIDVGAMVFSALDMPDVCETFTARGARKALDEGQVAILAAGTGNPYFTTDSAASLRAVEIRAELMIKATKVNGVYSADPVKDSQAVFYPQLTYDRALAENLQVMDATAIVLCRDNEMPLRIMNINDPGALMRLMRGEEIGSLVAKGG